MNSEEPKTDKVKNNFLSELEKKQPSVVSVDLNLIGTPHHKGVEDSGQVHV